MVVQEESAANLSSVTMTPCVCREQPAVREERRKVTLLSFFWLEFVLVIASLCSYSYNYVIAVDVAHLLRILILSPIRSSVCKWGEGLVDSDQVIEPLTNNLLRSVRFRIYLAT